MTISYIQKEMSKDFSHCSWTEQQWETFSSFILESHRLTVPPQGTELSRSEEVKYICFDRIIEKLYGEVF